MPGWGRAGKGGAKSVLFSVDKRGKRVYNRCAAPEGAGECLKRRKCSKEGMLG